MMHLHELPSFGQLETWTLEAGVLTLLVIGLIRIVKVEIWKLFHPGRLPSSQQRERGS